MDELIEFVEPYNEIQFLVSLDYSTDENEPYNCTDWSQLYPELGDYGNSPLILDGDPSHAIWNMFAGSTYSAYAFIDHNMVLRYKFDMPNLYDFQYTYIPNLLNEMYGCTDSSACNFSEGAVFDDDSCQYENDCNECESALNQLACMDIEGCMWMGDHCMESVDNCMDYENEIDCTNQNGCYWMGDHCMTGSNCADPIAYNYNPIADSLGQVDNTTCEYSPHIYFGCTYENAINFNALANVDDGSCSHELIDVNEDGIIDILDIILIVQIVIEG